MDTTPPSPRCWHSNEKVNIEPKILEVAGCGVVGRAQRGTSRLGPAWLHQGLHGRRHAQAAWEGTDLGRGVFSSLSPPAERGA